MKGRKLAAVVTSLMIGFQAVMPIPVALASESVTQASEESLNLAYLQVAFDGKENIVPLSDTTGLRLIEWKDETKTTVLAEYQFEDANGNLQVIPWEILATEEVVEFETETQDSVRIHLTEAETFHVEEVTPSVTLEIYLPIENNENGSSIEQAVIVDEAGFILSKKDEFQYILEENDVRTLISKEAYEAMNQEQSVDEEIEEEVPEEIVEEEETVEESDDVDQEDVVEEETETTPEVDPETEEVPETEVIEEEKEEVQPATEEAVSLDQPMMAAAIQARSIGNMPSVTYSTHVQSYGWMNDFKNGETAGTQGQSKRLEAIKINTDMSGLGISYSTHVEKKGWMPTVSNNALSGTTGEEKRLEAIKISLVGDKAKNYDVYYRVHAESHGWLGWAKNGAPAGTEGLAKRLEAIEVILVEKGSPAPGNTANSFVTSANNTVTKPVVNPLASYSSYVQGLGWQAPVENGGLSGTSGAKKRIEAIRIGIENIPGVNVRYSTHMQSKGWMNWSNGAGINGLPGSGKRMEAMKLELTGSNAAKYDIYYRVHVERFGWLGWAKNGQPAGSEGYGFRAEAYEVKVVPKGTTFNQGGSAFRIKDNASVVYSSHVQSLGWLGESKNGQSNGTTGRELRMEALKVSLKNDRYTGGVSYRTHVQSRGWMNAVTNGAISGTVGQGKRVEAIQISLTGEMAQHYDVYYRVHSESHGWLGWAKNGMSAGTEGMGKRVENIEIKLIEKGLVAPAVNAAMAFKKAQPKPEQKKFTVFIDPGHGGSDGGAGYFGTLEKDLNMQIAFKVEKYLKQAGYNVIMARTTDVFIDHKTGRSEMANKSGADIFISLHNNAMPGNSSVNGIETFWYEYDPDYQPAINKDMHNNPTRLKESERLAHAVQDALISTTGAYDRKVRRDTFAVLRETKIPAILVEFGFMSNLTELNRLKSNSYQETLAKALTNGVVKYFNGR